jgi:hypothetical protein
MVKSIGSGVLTGDIIGSCMSAKRNHLSRDAENGPGMALKTWRRRSVRFLRRKPEYASSGDFTLI